MPHCLHVAAFPPDATGTVYTFSQLGQANRIIGQNRLGIKDERAMSSKPLLLIALIRIDKLFIRFCQVDDALNDWNNRSNVSAECQ